MCALNLERLMFTLEKGEKEREFVLVKSAICSGEYTLSVHTGSFKD